MQKGHKKNSSIFQNKYLLSVIVLLGLFTIVASISAYMTYKISIEGSLHLLETRATDIAVNLGFSLERLGLNPDLFPDIVSSDRWEYLAFLALIDKDHTCILHSNQKLIGRRMDDQAIRRVFNEERIITHFERLATGEKVFLLDFPIKLHLGDKSMQGEGQTFLRKMTAHETPNTIKQLPRLKVFCLRVALHPYPALSIERKARFQLGMIMASFILLWVLAVFFIRAWKKNYQLELDLSEKERMAALGQMAAVLAHEIRNPLSTIKGFAQIYMEDASDPDLKEDMKVVVEQVERLERLTSNLLVYARPTRLFIEHFDIKDICSHLEKSFLGRNPQIELEIHCEGKEAISDRGKVLQILINLIQNSIEALREKEGEKKIHVSICADEDGLTLRVDDSGKGFPEKERNSIFEPFYTTKTKGTGLGLAIVKRLVDALKGEITLGKSRLGGASVLIFLPNPEREE